MQILVAYDISDNKARAKIFNFLKEKGLNTQKSIFECEMDAKTLQEVRYFMDNHMDPHTDSVLFYPMCNRCTQNVDVIGKGITVLKSAWTVL